MRRRAVLLAGAMLAMMVFTSGVMPERQARAASSQTKVEVTYYYLPG